MTLQLTVAHVEQLLAAASIVDLLAALTPTGQPTVADGGACPICDADAWAVDQLIWTCNGLPRERRHGERPAKHRGTILQLRDHVAANPDALARLAGADRIIGEPLRPADARPLPAVVDPDGWGSPTDMFHAGLRHPLDHDDQVAWLRQFARAHGAQLLADLLENLDDHQLTAALIDVRTQLRSVTAAQEDQAA